MSLQLEGKETLKYRCAIDPRTEKFYTTSNDHGRTHKYDFSVSYWKYNFRANLVQKLKLLI